MGFLEKYVKQCRKPSGGFGRFVGRSMNIGHTGIRRWGIKQITVNPDAYILDIGCGGGRAVKELASMTSDGKIFGIDYSENMTELSKRVNKSFINKGIVEIKHGSVSSLPFEDNMFDIVTAFETYYFWPDLISDLKEILRVLKHGGKLLLVNEVYKDAKFEKRNNKWVELLQMQLHTPDEYKQFLNKAGYHILHINTDSERNWIAAVAEKV
ncbi:MAG: class I SAM-dependent methyltransferase [Spirochaetes bacterium]|nr:class I SAM-dependent methyltransferase [Spirochaetota bacterium]